MAFVSEKIKMAYTNVASQVKIPKWLEFFLVQDEDTIPNTLSDDELARIL